MATNQDLRDSKSLFEREYRERTLVKIDKKAIRRTASFYEEHKATPLYPVRDDDIAFLARNITL